MLDLVMDASSFQEGLAGMVLFTAISPIFCLIQWEREGYSDLLNAICSLSELGVRPVFDPQWLKLILRAS
jgi:hypothetical protein